MICQVCEKNQATIHLTEINDGVRTEMHLCEQCAVEEGIAIKSQVPINELLGGLLESAPADDEMVGPADKKLSCPHCGFTLQQFRKEAVLGCPHDYEVFQKELSPLIAKAHNGKTSHVGKVPSKTSGETKKEMQLLTLSQQLDSAVKSENYELAAELRDKIAEIE